MDKNRVQGGAKNRRRLPLDLDTNDPKQVISFGLGLGYDQDNVVNTVVQRCNLDRITARQMVRDAASQLPQGGHR